MGEALAGSQNEVFFQEEYFSDYELKYHQVEDRETQDTTYLVHNKIRETVRAFRALHEQTEDVLYLPRTSQEEIAPIQELTAAMSGPVSVHPNPFHNAVHFRVQTDWQESLQVHLFDLSGRLLAEKTIDPKATEWDLEHLPAGVYLLQIQNQSGSIQQHLKLIKP